MGDPYDMMGRVATLKIKIAFSRASFDVGAIRGNIALKHLLVLLIVFCVIRPSCHIESKAFSISSRIIPNDFLFCLFKL